MSASGPPRRSLVFTGALLMLSSLALPAVNLSPQRVLSGLQTLLFAARHAGSQLAKLPSESGVQAVIALIAVAANVLVPAALIVRLRGSARADSLRWFALATVLAAAWLGWRAHDSALLELRHGYVVWMAGLCVLLAAAWYAARDHEQ